MFAKLPWHQLPRLFAMLRLIEIRNELREKNLHDTEEPPFEPTDIPADLDPALREERTLDGTFNDLKVPKMGAAGRRFGRNVPLEHVVPDSANLLVPNPRVVSRELMTRDAFQPATFLNLLAASWIQFMVHDWFVHKRSATDTIAIPTAAGDDWGAPAIAVPRSVEDPVPPGRRGRRRSPTRTATGGTGPRSTGPTRRRSRHSRPASAAGYASSRPGCCRWIPPPACTSRGSRTTGGSAWPCSIRSSRWSTTSSPTCSPRSTRSGTTPGSYAKARLIIAALMAKIHTVEWTPAILPHPVIQTAMRVNWSGLAGEDLQDLLMFLDDNELVGGIIGSQAAHHAAPYSLTEEFVAVYRMHPLMPDTFDFRSLATGRVLETRSLMEVSGRRTPDIASRIPMPDLFYSFGTSHPGAITLHNYPRTLQNLTRDDGERLDLAAVDIVRDRERGVPRYNQFRRLFRKEPVRSFDELTDNLAWRQQIKQVYNGDIESVDLMTGLFAEPLPPGFGFSESAFRVFILMASRRLKSDRFYTDDWTASIYTEFGLDWIRKTSMLSLLRRHYPHLAPALAGVANAFHPWTPVGSRAGVTAPVTPTVP